MNTVKEILERKGSAVCCIGRKASVLEAVQEMNAHRIGAIVVNDGDRIVGIFTERDVLTRVVAQGLDPANTPVEKVMTSQLACCMPETPLEECKSVMTEKRIRHLPVVKDHRLLGIITSGDILFGEKHREQQTIKYLKEYIHGPYAASSD